MFHEQLQHQSGAFLLMLLLPYSPLKHRLFFSFTTKYDFDGLGKKPNIGSYCCSVFEYALILIAFPATVKISGNGSCLLPCLLKKINSLRN